MKHSVRLSKITRRETPKGMRKIVVDGKVYFYRVHRHGESVTILDSLRKPFKDVMVYGDYTWTPRDIAHVIKKQNAILNPK